MSKISQEEIELLKSKFETGDKPTGDDFSNLIDLINKAGEEPVVKKESPPAIKLSYKPVKMGYTIPIQGEDKEVYGVVVEARYPNVILPIKDVGFIVQQSVMLLISERTDSRYFNVDPKEKGTEFAGFVCSGAGIDNDGNIFTLVSFVHKGTYADVSSVKPLKNANNVRYREYEQNVDFDFDKDSKAEIASIYINFDSDDFSQACFEITIKNKIYILDLSQGELNVRNNETSVRGFVWVDKAFGDFSASFSKQKQAPMAIHLEKDGVVIPAIVPRTDNLSWARIDIPKSYIGGGDLYIVIRSAGEEFRYLFNSKKPKTFRQNYEKNDVVYSAECMPEVTHKELTSRTIYMAHNPIIELTGDGVEFNQYLTDYLKTSSYPEYRPTHSKNHIIHLHYTKK